MNRINIYMLFNNCLSLKNDWSRKAIPEETNSKIWQLPGCFASAAPVLICNRGEACCTVERVTFRFVLQETGNDTFTSQLTAF